MQKYITIASPSTSEITEKRSRFIATAAPVSTEEEALTFITKIKAENRDARHNIYAYLLRGGAKKCSDDGEPQGTGGIPTLQVLEKSGIVDCAITVTRYFGGILLGAGGLVRAYSGAASAALTAAEKITMGEAVRCRVACEYTLHGKIAALAAAHGEITATEYTENVSLELYLPAGKTEIFEKALTEISSGTVRLERFEKIFRKIP